MSTEIICAAGTEEYCTAGKKPEVDCTAFENTEVYSTVGMN